MTMNQIELIQQIEQTQIEQNLILNQQIEQQHQLLFHQDMMNHNNFIFSF